MKHAKAHISVPESSSYNRSNQASTTLHILTISLKKFVIPLLLNTGKKSDQEPISAKTETILSV